LAAITLAPERYYTSAVTLKKLEELCEWLKFTEAA
jgi:hypothetical protein